MYHVCSSLSISCTTHSYLRFSIPVFNFSNQAQRVSAGVIAGGVTGGVTATAVLVLCCIVFAVVYIHKRKHPAFNADKTRYDLIRLISP